ncbi:hypothetical protein [Streptomyces sp. NBC_00829]|uniref:hypothetical protein n=1 Tax=Streptomyces sp. NBC_00829 TaxID=2903679 RepID=UPI00386611F0|nr:hypothetical protein OG293_32275 [Streptomyces sp. NBC_00829]
MRTAAELMATDYRTTTVEQAPGSADDTVVVLDDAGRPRWVVGPAGCGLAVEIGPDAPVSGLSALPAVLDLLNGGLPAVLVVEEERLIGLLDASLVKEELLRALEEDGDAIGTVLDGDWELYGAPVAPVGLVRVRCQVCGTVAEVDEFPIAEVPCPGDQSHLLVDSRMG